MGVRRTVVVLAYGSPVLLRLPVLMSASLIVTGPAKKAESCSHRRGMHPPYSLALSPYCRLADTMM